MTHAWHVTRVRTAQSALRSLALYGHMWILKKVVCTSFLSFVWDNCLISYLHSCGTVWHLLTACVSWSWLMYVMTHVCQHESTAWHLLTARVSWYTVTHNETYYLEILMIYMIHSCGTLTDSTCVMIHIMIHIIWRYLRMIHTYIWYMLVMQFRV